MPEKEYIPHTNPNWNLELPDGDSNSLVDKHGTSHDDGYNFDEKDDEGDYETTAEKQRAKNAARGEEALKDANALDK